MAGASEGGVLVCGNLVYDILVRPVEAIVWNATIWVDSIGESLGGNGGNTSYALGRLGVPVRLLSLTGPDSYGDKLLALLRGAGVDVRGVGRSRGPTPVTIALVNAAGDRSFLHRPGSSAEAFETPPEFSPDLLEGLSRFHLANLCGVPHMRLHAPDTLRRAKAAGLATSLDTGWDSRGRWMADIGPCLEHVDLLFANECEARMLAGTDDRSRAARTLRDAGAGAVVMKLGGEGCAVYSAEGEARIPAYDVDVVDTTGAGDCFVGGFLAGLRRGDSFEEAARLANAVAALSVQSLGGVTGLRNLAETEAWMRTARIRG